MAIVRWFTAPLPTPRPHESPHPSPQRTTTNWTSPRKIGGLPSLFIFIIKQRCCPEECVQSGCHMTQALCTRDQTFPSELRFAHNIALCHIRSALRPIKSELCCVFLLRLSSLNPNPPTTAPATVRLPCKTYDVDRACRSQPQSAAAIIGEGDRGRAAAPSSLPLAVVAPRRLESVPGHRVVEAIKVGQQSNSSCGVRPATPRSRRRPRQVLGRSIVGRTTRNKF